MTNFKYEVSAYYNDRDYPMTCRTNEIDIMFAVLFEHVANGVWVEVIDGFTGELLCSQNHPEEPYMQDEFGLMVLGYLMEKVWG